MTLLHVAVAVVVVVFIVLFKLYKLICVTENCVHVCAWNPTVLIASWLDHD